MNQKPFALFKQSFFVSNVISCGCDGGLQFVRIGVFCFLLIGFAVFFLHGLFILPYGLAFFSGMVFFICPDRIVSILVSRLIVFYRFFATFMQTDTLVLALFLDLFAFGLYFYAFFFGFGNRFDMCFFTFRLRFFDPIPAFALRMLGCIRLFFCAFTVFKRFLGFLSVPYRFFAV